MSFVNPYWYAAEGFPDATLVYRTGSGFTGTAVQFTDAKYDSLGAFDSGTNPNRLTVQSSGLYRCIGSLDTGGVTDQVKNAIMRDSGGTEKGTVGGYGSSRQVTGQFCTGILSLAATDYSELFSDGSLTWPNNQNTWHYLERIPAGTAICRVYNSNTPTINTTESAIGWNTEDVKDTGFLHDNVTNNGRITIDTGGPTLVRPSCSVFVNAGSTGSVFMRVRKNGNLIAGSMQQQCDAGGSGAKLLSWVGPPIECVATDYFEVFAFINTGSLTLASTSRSWFQLEEVDPTAYTNYARCMVKLTGGDTVTSSFADVSWDAAEYDPDSLWSAGTPTEIAVPADCNYARIYYGAEVGSTTAVFSIGPSGDFAEADAGNAFASTDAAGNERIGGYGPWVKVTPSGALTLQTRVSASTTTFQSPYFAWWAVEFASF